MVSKTTQTKQTALYKQTCSICDEDMTHAFKSTVDMGYEQFTQTLCDHSFCVDCTVQWVQARLDSSARILCAHEDCSCLMMASDVKRLDVEAGTSLHERMRKMMHTEHSTMHTTIAEDSANQKWVEENCAKCTSCGVYVEHGGACDQMVCHCGEKFSFKAQQLFKVRATVGAVVMIDNLVSQTSCNGTTGIVVTALRSGRFAVNLETGTTISFHARNLVVVFDEDVFNEDIKMILSKKASCLLGS